MNKIKTLLLATMIVSPIPVAAQVVTYSDRGAFVLATGADTVEDFTDTSHFPIPGGVLNSSTTEAGLQPGDILPGVTYSTDPCTGVAALCFNIDSGGGFAGGFLDSLDQGEERILTIDFDDAQRAFGFDTNQLMSEFTVTAFAGATQIYSDSFTATGSTLTFFGFESLSDGVTRVVIDGTDGGAFNFALDNFTFGATAVPVVPEPASWAMMIGGFGLVGGAMRRSRTKIAFA